MTTTSKNIWVTGASSGLGRSLALKLAAQGHRVIVSARNEVELNALEKLDQSITALSFDITDETSMESVAQRLASHVDYLDLVVLNAGNCEYLDFPNPDWAAIRRVMEVNFFGSINCLQLALPLLRQNRQTRPQIICIASQATAAPFPRAEAYGASKAALQYFFNSLRIDLAQENIDVSVVNPGFVDTPLTRKNDFEMPFLMSVDSAAKRVLRQIETRPRNYSFPKRLSVLLALSKLAPALWQKMVGAKPVDKKPNDKIEQGKIS